MIAKIKRALLFFKQRKQLGFDDSDLWSLDVTVADFVLPRLKRFRFITVSYPHSFDSLEEWQATLDKMIYSFEQYSSGIENADPERFDEGLKLFGLYFSSLWD